MATLLMEEVRKDVSLKDYTLDSEKLSILKKLRDQQYKAPLSVCTERAALVTKYRKSAEKENDPVIVSQAKAINYYLSHRNPLFNDDNLLAGSTSSKIYGAPVYIETFGMSIWPELDTINNRKENPIKLTKEEANALNFDIYPYWMDKTLLELARPNLDKDALSLMEKMVFFLNSKTSVISHTTPYYEEVLQHGLNAMIDDLENNKASLASKNEIDFYNAMQISMQGILNYAKHLSEKAAELAEKENDKTRKSELLKISEICSRVPASGATSYREAVNSIWLCHVGVLAENVNMAIGPGRLDQILYPYFEKDLEAKNITIEEALNITGCLWFKIADNGNLVPETAQKLFGGAGSVPAVTLGGTSKDGDDAVNDLTYIMLRITELLRIKDPNVNARFNYKFETDDNKRYRDRISEVIINTKAIPAIYNDVTNSETLRGQGVSPEYANDYAVVGCVELGSAGREYMASSSVLLNLTAPLEMALFNGKRPYVFKDKQIGPQTGAPEDMKTFNDFWNAFSEQFKWLSSLSIKLNDNMGRTYQKYLPSPLLSSFFCGPKENKKDLIFGGAKYNSSGITHIGFADVCDSINAIEYAVFQEKSMTFQEMTDAVINNFSGKYKKYLDIINKAPKYGTEDKNALKNAGNLVELIYGFYQKHTNYRGGKYRPAFWTMTNHAGLGTLGGALPSGRKAKVVYSSGITPASQCARELTAAFNAVGDLNSTMVPGGYALNMKYSPETQNSNDINYHKKFGDLFESYFKKGGMQVQFNLLSYEELIDAKKHPEKYPHLIVRVSGYSAYFNDLNEAMKDELISRTQYDLMTGKSVDLPGGFKGGK